MIPKNIENLRVVRYPDPVLSQVCAPLESFGSEVQRLAERMLELMHEARGVGLAAPQVGLLLRLFVCNPTNEEGEDRVYGNPRFLELTGAEEREEGCLSLPEASVMMRRATHAVIEARDATGQVFTVTSDELAARVWQHETDHLDGKLIIDRMSEADEIANRRILKQLKEEYA